MERWKLPPGPSDFSPEESEPLEKCPHCGASIRVEDDSCLRCLLSEGLIASNEDTRDALAQVLKEAEVPER